MNFDQIYVNTRISPAKAEKHDLLFRIKYDPYRFTNSMLQFKLDCIDWLYLN